MANKLALETSPYLLQHKNNPVEWYPWGEEALSLARSQNRPILLSIGYSACHWCHVMEHESFTNDEIAKLMNENFVNIKVDREERPDLDQIYQNVAIAMTQSGGWPLTVFLTPDLKPFYGGTYFPPTDKYGRPGFPKVIKALSEAFKNDFESVSENANRLIDFIASSEKVTFKDSKLPTSADLQLLIAPMLEQVDWINGGFGGAPKFPNPMLLAFLWRFGSLVSLPRARDAAVLSLTRMASGGVYDQLGGGFHRYSVDATWSVPHFEKMLYDNALLLKLYAEVLLEMLLEAKGTPKVAPFTEEKELYLKVLEETSEYVMREMTSPEGGFYAAQDADSEGEEGKFFVWGPSDLAQEVLTHKITETEAVVFQLRYGILEQGNFENGKTVPHIANSIADIAQLSALPESQVLIELESAKSKLLAIRSTRIQPGLDHKVLTGWNGLMISGMIWAARALMESGKTEMAGKVEAAAVKAFNFVLQNLVNKPGRLFSSFQGGRGKGNGYLDDYAFMAMAALDLSRFSLDSKTAQKYLAHSDEWINTVLSHFKDPKDPGYYFTSDDHEALIQRPKTVFDQAIPSGTAVALTCMQALAELDFKDNRNKYESEVDEQLSRLFATAERNAYGLGELLSVYLLKNISPVTVSGADAGLLCLHPFVFQQPVSQGDTGKYTICHERTCSLPMISRDHAIHLLNETLRF
ncbi:MAG: thioredoxin domain-containing protein [Bdellovibrionia bacterium]